MLRVALAVRLKKILWKTSRQACKENLDATSALFFVDFSENDNCKLAEEIKVSTLVRAETKLLYTQEFSICRVLKQFLSPQFPPV